MPGALPESTERTLRVILACCPRQSSLNSRSSSIEAFNSIKPMQPQTSDKLHGPCSKPADATSYLPPPSLVGRQTLALPRLHPLASKSASASLILILILGIASLAGTARSPEAGSLQMSTRDANTRFALNAAQSSVCQLPSSAAKLTSPCGGWWGDQSMGINAAIAVSETRREPLLLRQRRAITAPCSAVVVFVVVPA